MKNLLIIVAILGLCMFSVKFFSPDSIKQRDQEENEKLNAQYETMMNQLGSTMVAVDGEKGMQNYQQAEEVLSGLMGK